jgi:uncharacterized protein YjbJ (UPF0337 family)
MTDRGDEPTESPATWENVVVGKAKHLFGRVLGDEELAEEGEEQEEIAHEVHDEVDGEHQD